MNNPDPTYNEAVIKKGDIGSSILEKLTSQTLENSEFVKTVNIGRQKANLVSIPDDYLVIVHSACGNHGERDVSAHAASMVQNLIDMLRRFDAKPIAFANVIDSNSGDDRILQAAAKGMIHMANTYRLAILNGENAILGERINPDIQANVSGTMVSIIKKDRAKPGVYNIGKDYLAIFDPNGRKVYVNSDGVGTKTEIYERLKAYHELILQKDGLENYERGLVDSAAMKADDLIKLGAHAKVISDVVETRTKDLRIQKFYDKAKKIGKRLDAGHILQWEIVGDRICGPYKQAINISGSSVSTIDDRFIQNPLRPNARDYLIAIRGNPNPRSNGITDKRKAMIKMLGERWELAKDAEYFFKYLAEPSTFILFLGN